MDTNIASTIRNVARKQATDVMDPEDLEQELWVFYLEQLQDRDYPEGAVVDLIKKQAAKTARQERIDYMQFRGAFIYSPAVVRTILEDAVWVDAEDSPDVEGRIDVSNALAELGSSDRRVLHKRFAVNPADRDPLTDTEKKQIERAIDKISMILNGNGRAEVDMTIAAELNTTPVFA